jgi:sensor c-di-GMP phosphodiesterase-like protein
MDLNMIRSALDAREFSRVSAGVSLRDGQCFGAEALTRWQGEYRLNASGSAR